MNDNQNTLDLLAGIKTSLEDSLENQKKMISLHEARFEFMKKRYEESIALQKLAVKRQETIAKVLWPLAVSVLIVLVFTIYFTIK